MTEKLDDILQRIHDLQRDLDKHIDAQREKFRFQLRRGRVVFDREIKSRHRELKIRLSAYVKQARWPVVVTAPVIYSLIIPLVLLDIFVTIYQFTCFPAYGIPRVRRPDYMAIDRHHLAYSTLWRN